MRKSKNLHKHLNSEHGAAAVEFALILPVLVLLLFGSIEFGLLMFNKAVLTNAAREGARFGIVSAVPRNSQAQIAAVVTNYTGSNLVTFGTPSTPQVTSTFASQNFGDPLTVRVSYQYQFLVIDNLIPSLNGGVQVNAQSTMNYE